MVLYCIIVSSTSTRPTVQNVRSVSSYLKIFWSPYPECSNECDSTTPPPFITAATTAATLCDCKNPDTPDSIKKDICECPEPEPETPEEPESSGSAPEASGSSDDDCNGDDCHWFLKTYYLYT